MLNRSDQCLKTMTQCTTSFGMADGSHPFMHYRNRRLGRIEGPCALFAKHSTGLYNLKNENDIVELVRTSKKKKARIYVWFLYACRRGDVETMPQDFMAVAPGHSTKVLIWKLPDVLEKVVWYWDKTCRA